jgi:hypothetical protein
MATMLDECTIKEQRFVVHFLWAEGLSTKDIHKEMFRVYGGKCLLRKVVHKRVEKFSQGHLKSQMMPDQVQKWLRQQSKDLYSAGFNTLVK